MTPRDQLIYRYLQVAVSMTVDLHLDTNPNIVARQSGFRSCGGALQLTCDKSSSRECEAFRAALGCFYLSSV